MARLGDLTAGACVGGVSSDGPVDAMAVKWFGDSAMGLAHKMPETGQTGARLLYRDDELGVVVLERGPRWPFDGDGHLFRLVSEARRIKVAHLLDPVLAVHTSDVGPPPHQIAAAYESMLPGQPLGFLLADDPGAGKTIVAGLLVKELGIRGDVERCLVVYPRNPAERWRHDLSRRLQLSFEIVAGDKPATGTGNWFSEAPMAIAPLDTLARSEKYRELLKAREDAWDLIICDEARKTPASFFGGEVDPTKRYNLDQLLSGLTRHFLLLAAAPHNGKDGDFQLFMALLDADRLEGKFRGGAYALNVSYMMRRMVNEKTFKFDATPLFPKRVAKSVPYELPDGEARLYAEVTDYVRKELDRAEDLENDGRKRSTGFALTILQRRLASPCHDNTNHAEPSDYFYVWLRPLLRNACSDLFPSISATLDEEMMAAPRLKNADQRFEKLVNSALATMRKHSNPEFPVPVFYAYKQQEKEQDGTASTGWGTMLTALVHAGFQIVGAWPMRTELSGRTNAPSTNALASSIVPACRIRPPDAPAAARRESVSALRTELSAALQHMRAGNTAPADLAQASAGSGMSVFARCAKVLNADGEALSVRDALALVDQTLDGVLAEQEGGFDADTRRAPDWFAQCRFGDGAFGMAETLSKAKNTRVEGMMDAGILASDAGNVRLLRPGDLPEDWDPEQDKRFTIWGATHRMTRMLGGGESAAAGLMAKLGSNAASARELACRPCHMCERKSCAQEARDYNALVQSWPEISGLSREEAA